MRKNWQKNWQNSVLFLVSFKHVWYVDKEKEQNSRNCPQFLGSPSESRQDYCLVVNFVDWLCSQPHMKLWCEQAGLFLNALKSCIEKQSNFLHVTVMFSPPAGRPTYMYMYMYMADKYTNKVRNREIDVSRISVMFTAK